MRLAKLQELTLSELITNATKEFIFVMAKFYLYPFRFISCNRFKFNKKTNSIILLHGFGRSKTDWFWFQLYAKKLLPNVNFYTFNLRPHLGSIEEIAASLHPKIENLLQSDPSTKVSMIGHSMGGIVASYYKLHYDLTNRIQNIVTIGSPLHGSKLAVAAAGKNMRQIEPDSQFLTVLREEILQQKINFFNIASKADNLIFPWTSPILTKMQEHTLILDKESHQGLIYNKKVIQQIAQWLV